MASFTINEPHPTVPQNAYTHSGRGGAGNTFRVSTPVTSPAGVPTKACSHPPPPSSSSGRFYSGRGGAGNAHAASERVAMSFEDEYAEAARHAAAWHGHVGRGGAGNVVGASPATSSGSARRDSSSTSGSERSGFWARLGGSSRH